MNRIHPITCSLLLFVLLPACRKSDTSAVPTTTTASGPTAGMSGVRNWHRSHYYDANGIHFSTPIHEFYYLADTSFALTIVSDSAIRIFDSTYQYQSTDTVKKTRYFGTAYYFEQYGMGQGVIYYYTKDSIVYCSGDRHATSDQWTRRDLCYTY